ncbi:hypothetical protein WR25_21088 [Diploscapter pachys]|uniref:26S proteasome regulatory subunit RPN11 C-terminal domain-containing protein n=1 Tax=Diploscapter pachys TaxID=2018661 RepID=A0A2A2KFJ5_9BILA|nr:hypothetical protein WR25_21088 [Diploscapter pachys]
MLLSFTNKNWRQALQIVYPSYLDKNNMTHLEEMTKIFKSYNEELESGRLMTKREGEVQKYGRLNTKHQLKMMSNSMLASNIMQVNLWARSDLVAMQLARNSMMLGAIVNMKTTEEAVKAKAEANKKMARVSLRSSFHVSHDNATTPVADRNSPNAQSQTTNEQPRQSKKKENNSINRK